MQGRVHGYEGYSPEEVTFPVRVLGRLGITTLVVTNAAGGIRLDLQQGQLVLLSDHINLTGRNPVAGPNDERFGPRFFDMTNAYAKRLRLLAHSAAERSPRASTWGCPDPALKRRRRSGPSAAWEQTWSACPRCMRSSLPAIWGSRYSASPASPTWLPASSISRSTTRK